MSDTTIGSWEPLIAQIAKGISRQFPPVEVDDISQELRLFLHVNAAKFAQVPEGSLEAYVYKSLDRTARDYALKERNRGLVQDDRYYYMPDFVAEILPVLFTRADWENCPRTEAPDIKSGEPLAIMVDLSIAWDTLGEKQKRALKAVTDCGQDFTAAASLLGYSTDESARVTYKRAIADLTDRMNGETRKRAANYEGIGSRDARSNSQAISLTGKDF